MSNLAEQIREALSMFACTGTQPALIGGLAVVALQVVRATKDVDFLLDVGADPNSIGVTAVLAAEAGVPYAPALGETSGVDPFTEWLDLMEVVQMLCPAWPVRDQPMQGAHWRL